MKLNEVVVSQMYEMYKHGISLSHKIIENLTHTQEITLQFRLKTLFLNQLTVKIKVQSIFSNI